MCSSALGGGNATVGSGLFGVPGVRVGMGSLADLYDVWTCWVLRQFSKSSRIGSLACQQGPSLSEVI